MTEVIQELRELYARATAIQQTLYRKAEQLVGKQVYWMRGNYQQSGEVLMTGGISSSIRVKVRNNKTRKEVWLQLWDVL